MHCRLFTILTKKVLRFLRKEFISEQKKTLFLSRAPIITQFFLTIILHVCKLMRGNLKSD